MLTSVPIAGALIVAAVVPPRSKSPFNRAELIVKHDAHEDGFVQVRGFTADGHAEGVALTPVEKQSLLDVGQAVELSSGLLTSGAMLWVLRQNLPRRDRALDDLRASGSLLHMPEPGLDDAWLCVVDQSKASTLLDRWKGESVVAAKRHGMNKEWPLAELEARTAHAMSRGLDAQILALLSFTHEQCGRERRAQGLVTMARRSRGEDFAAEMTNAIERLRHELDELAAARSSRLLEQRPRVPAIPPEGRGSLRLVTEHEAEVSPYARAAGC